MNKVIIILLSLILILLTYLTFRNDISWYFEKQHIKENAKWTNFLGLNLACAQTSNNIECEKESKRIIPLANKFDALIDSKRSISCDDFSSRNEAQDFQDYIGGDRVRRVENNFEGEYKDYRCPTDYYGLDTDHDCEPCENNQRFDAQAQEDLIRSFQNKQ